MTYLGTSQQHLAPVGADHYLHLDVVNAFTALQTAAQQANLDLQICSSFRSFERQLSIWNRKWRGELPLYDINGQLLAHDNLTDEQKLHAILLWSALPGASRHHWGTDFDVYDEQSVQKQQHKLQLVVAEYEGNGPCAALSSWLDKHAHEYGFYRPYAIYTGGVAVEPWHLSHRVTAQKIQASYQKDKLASLLENSDILGKSLVLSHLDSIFVRYTLNQGTQ